MDFLFPSIALATALAIARAGVNGNRLKQRQHTARPNASAPEYYPVSVSFETL
jgi:hypothetical protein